MATVKLIISDLDAVAGSVDFKLDVEGLDTFPNKTAYTAAHMVGAAIMKGLKSGDYIRNADALAMVNGDDRKEARPVDASKVTFTFTDKDTTTGYYDTTINVESDPAAYLPTAALVIAKYLIGYIPTKTFLDDVWALAHSAAAQEGVVITNASFAPKDGTSVVQDDAATLEAA